MAVIQRNDNRHCHRPNSVSEHFLLHRDEGQIFIHRTVCSSLIHLPRVLGVATEEQLDSSSHPRATLAAELLWKMFAFEVTLDMHHQQRFVEWSIAKTLACYFSTMWAQIKKKNCHSQCARRQRRKREGFAFRAQILIKDLFLSAFPVSWPSLSSLGWGWSKLAWQIPLNLAQVFA